MKDILLTVPDALKVKLDQNRAEGYTLKGYINAVLERELVDATIRRLSDNLGVTFVIVTHDLGSVFVAMDRVILLDRRAKGIIAEGDPRAIRDHTTDPRVRAFFRREAEPVAS